VAVTLYDLIPCLFPKTYLSDPAYRQWYQSKLAALQKADLCLTISESTRLDAQKHCQTLPSKLINISADADPHFRLSKPTPSDTWHLKEKLNIQRPFILCTGGDDPRKGLTSLITAFANLPIAIRLTHQLVIVCKLSPTSAARLHHFAFDNGLQAHELVLTGQVTDHELLALYNLSSLFVFPSLYEGFGLPVLEAMRCGAAVLASRNSSLVEIVAWEEAMFDATSTEQMTQLIAKGLSEADFRQALIHNSEVQSKRFSWELSARHALAAMERHRSSRASPSVPVKRRDQPKRPRLAFVSPLPPERYGISDYSAQLLPALSSHYQIDVIVHQAKVKHPWIERSCPMVSVNDFVQNHTAYDRVVYQMGNSHFHAHMFGLLQRCPGLLVLHDFYLSGVISQLRTKSNAPHYWVQNLFHSHGYGALHEFFHGQSRQATAIQYSCSLSVIEAALGVLVHSKHATDLAKHWYGLDAQNFSVVPLVRDTHLKVSRTQARQALDLPDDVFLVCSFGYLTPAKLNQKLIAAWAKVMKHRDQTNARLVFVGDHLSPHYEKSISEQLATFGLNEKVHITGWTDEDQFHTWLAAADVCVHLRSESRGETSAAVLDCMNYGKATIANAHGSMDELPSDAVLKISDNFSEDELAQAIGQMMVQPQARLALGCRAREAIITQHSPEVVAAHYANTIEATYLLSPHRRIQRKPRMYIDINTMVEGKLSSKQQEAAEKRLLAWLCRANFSHRVEPIYGTQAGGFKRAQRYAFKLMKLPIQGSDTTIQVMEGDVLTSV
jgi:glycosyltransferase involved in cell wall biosynthesis